MSDTSKTTEAWITKGTRVRYSYFQMKRPLGSLAGAQLKFGADLIEGTGEVLDVRCDGCAPDGTPLNVKFLLKPDGGGADIEVPAKGIVGLA